MASDRSDEHLRDVLGTLSQHPLTDQSAWRVQLAAEGRPVPLRLHETLALALPKGLALKLERVELLPDGTLQLWSEHATYLYEHPLRPPTVEELPRKPLIHPDESLFWGLARQTCGPATIVRDDRGETIEGAGHPAFAEIQRDTVRVVDGMLRYVGWAESHRFDTGRLRKGPSLVVNGVATPVECGERPKFIADGDELYVLTPELEQVREPEPEGMFTPGDDGKRRDTRIRSLDGRVNVVARHSRPDDWNFVAKVGNRLVLTGMYRPYHATPHPMSSVILLDDGLAFAFDGLRGNGRRVPGGALVACDTDVGPGFYWFHEEGGREYPLYGKLENLSPAGERALNGWHVEGNTLFLTRYDR